MYIINEYQTTNDVTAIVTPATATNEHDALSIFYARCAAAAVSAVPKHTVIIETDEGFQIDKNCFLHG